MSYSKIICTITFALFCCFQSFGQLSSSLLEVKKEYGTEYKRTQINDTSFILFYLNPVMTKASGSYIQRKAFYFGLGEDNNYYCFKYQILEPGTETPINVHIYNRDMPSTGNMKWKDEKTGVTYTIEVVKDHCLISAFIEDQNQKTPETMFHTF